MKSFRSLVLIGLALLAQLALAQNTPVRVRATITSFDGKVLAVKTREGEVFQIHLPDNVSVAAAKTITLADIKPGDCRLGDGKKCAGGAGGTGAALVPSGSARRGV